MSVARAELEISPTEFVEWLEFERIDPSGPARDNMHAAVIAKSLHACHGSRTKLSDFMLEFEVEKKEVTEGTLRGIFSALKAREQYLNANVNRKT